MGTPIAGKPHTTPLVGDEKVPLSPDGHATTQEIADLGGGGGGGLTTLTLTYNGSSPFDVLAVVPVDFDPLVGGEISGLFPSTPFLGTDLGPVPVVQASVDGDGVITKLIMMTHFTPGSPGMDSLESDGTFGASFLTDISGIANIAGFGGIWVNQVGSIRYLSLLSVLAEMATPLGTFQHSVPMLKNQQLLPIVSDVFSSPLSVLAAGEDVNAIGIIAPYFTGTLSLTVDLYVTNAGGTESIHIHTTTSLTSAEEFRPAAADWSTIDSTGTDLTVVDEDGEGVVRSTAGGVFQATMRVTLDSSSTDNVARIPAAVGTFAALPGWYSPPVEIDAGVNDEFVFTGDGGEGTPETFTIPAGSYASATEMADAMGAATGTITSLFSDLVTFIPDYPTVDDITAVMRVAGFGQNDNTLTTGGNDALATIGFASPALFGGGAG